MSDGERPLPPSPYERMGGDDTVRALVDRFYALMDTLPEARDIRRLHAEDLSGARDKLFDFLSGWLGGPQRYVEKYGHPRLRARHLPFPIGVRERDQWLLCMERAMRDVGLPEDLQRQLRDAFFRTADHMRNQTD